MVRFTNPPTNVTGEARTNSAGYFTSPLLSPGGYRPRAEAAHYQARKIYEMNLAVASLAGMGRTDQKVPGGEASPVDPLARPEAAPMLTSAGQEAQILFAGLTPGLVGLYQINFQVPENAPSGERELMVGKLAQPRT